MAPPPRKIIFLTNPEFGQLNVQLSTAYALLQQAPDVEVHFGTHRSVEAQVRATSDMALRECPPSRTPIVFHHIGPSYMECLDSKPRSGADELLTKPGFFHMWSRAELLMAYACPWDTQQYVEHYELALKVLDEVRPDLAAVDSICCPALTAVRIRKIKFHLLLPNSLKEVYHGPDTLWKYPGMALGYPFPVPWHLVPANIAYGLRLAYGSFYHPGFVELRKNFQAKYGFQPFTLAPMDLQVNPEPGLKRIVAAAPELDYPFPNLGDDVIACGPIMKPFPALEASDASLSAWLARGPTILINLGSHRAVDEDMAVEIATALRVVLASAAAAAVPLGRLELARLQVLWKLKQTGINWFRGYTKYSVNEPGSRLHGVLGGAFDADRVRVVDWITAEPISILDSGNVICYIHHAGANAALEAIYAGVRHVALPGWADCYDWATRIEYLGIGLWGSREACPHAQAEELAETVKKVIWGPHAGRMQARAEELSRWCKKRESGRDMAASTLLAEMTALGS